MLFAHCMKFSESLGIPLSISDKIPRGNSGNIPVEIVVKIHLDHFQEIIVDISEANLGSIPNDTSESN